VQYYSIEEFEQLVTNCFLSHQMFTHVKCCHFPLLNKTRKYVCIFSYSLEGEETMSVCESECITFIEASCLLRILF